MVFGSVGFEVVGESPRSNAQLGDPGSGAGPQCLSVWVCGVQARLRSHERLTPKVNDLQPEIETSAYKLGGLRVQRVWA